MTSSIQLRSKVPCGARSSVGVVYFAVAGARPGDLDDDERLRSAAAASDTRARTRSRAAGRSRSKIGCELGRRCRLDVRAARAARRWLLSVSGSYCGDVSPTEMTRMFASAAACSASARDASLPTSVPSERSTTVVRSSPWASASADDFGECVVDVRSLGGRRRLVTRPRRAASLSVVKSVRTSSSGPKTTTATGRLSLRSARNARAATIAFWIGAPFMLFDASMRRTAPLLEPPAGATATSRTG